MTSQLPQPLTGQNPAAGLNFQASSLNSATTKKPGTVGLEFESMILSNMLRPMFDGLSSEGLFGGGEGEEAFKSFYIDALAGQIARSGGVGISDQVQKQLLMMQEQG